MAQNKIMINDDANTPQPDAGLGYDYETTYGEDTARVIKGKMHLNPLFTVEAFSYTKTNLTKSEMKNLLQKIAKGKSFKLWYFSPYYGEWRSDYFYCGKGSLSIGSLKENKERFSSISFNMIGVNPID